MLAVFGGILFIALGVLELDLLGLWFCLAFLLRSAQPLPKVKSRIP